MNRRRSTPCLFAFNVSLVGLLRSPVDVVKPRIPGAIIGLQSAMAPSITRLTLYKHGLGFFERYGMVDANFTLEFPRRAMDDVLKSLCIFPESATVTGVAFETPLDRNPEAHRQMIELPIDTPISGIISAFAGQRARITVRSNTADQDNPTSQSNNHMGGNQIEGVLIGLESEAAKHLKRALLAILADGATQLIPLSYVTQIALLDIEANNDLAYALEQRQRTSERSYARVFLSSESTVHVNYIAPAPAWRVSYRVIASSNTPDNSANNTADSLGACEILLQGWGLFDNTLDEDLENVQLTLTAGMPVSFRYALHEPHTPTRPFVEDEQRTVSAPIEFSAPAAAGSMSFEAASADSPVVLGAMSRSASRPKRAQFSDIEQNAPIQAAGESIGSLFAYRINAPVTVRRGESGMAPILSLKTKGQRQLLFNPQKHQTHPAASIRFLNGDDTLERGPATIVDDNEYAGEAVISFSPGSSEVILAFAIELGIAMAVETTQREETVAIYVRDGSMFVETIDYINTLYRSVSQLAKPSIVTIEHPRNYNSTLVTEPLESTLNEARFNVPIVPHGKSELTVVEQRTRSSQQDVRGINGFTLKQFLDTKLLSDVAYGELSAILESQSRIESLIVEREKRDQRRTKTRARLEDTRGNLAPLDPVQDAKLRERFLNQLMSLEDTMRSLDTQDEQCTLEIASIEDSITTAIARL
jgi:hypothetical protein